MNISAKLAALRSEVAPLLRTSAWAVKITWATSAGLTLGLVGVVILRGLLPAGLAVTARGLINAAVQVSQDSGGGLAPLVPWLILGFVVALVEALTPLANKLFLQRLADDLNFSITSDVLRHAATLDIASLEDPRLRDTIDRTQQQSATAFSQLVTNLQMVCSDTIEIVLMAGILMYLEPLVLLVVCPFALPYLFFRWRSARLRYDDETTWTTQRRWARYFVSHLTGPQAAVETKLLDLGPLFLARFRALMTQLRDRAGKRYRRDFAGGTVFAVLTTVSFYLLFARVALLVSRGVLTVGDIAVFAGVSTRLRVTLERLVVVISSVMEQALHVATLRDFLAITPRILTTVE